MLAKPFAGTYEIRGGELILELERISQLFDIAIRMFIKALPFALFFIGMKCIDKRLNYSKKKKRIIKRTKEELEEHRRKHEPGAFRGKRLWYPTGWTFNEKTKLWEPPDYISNQSKEKWRWDEKKQIWIDREREARLERYQEFRRSQGKEPTFEEWKAAREAEQKSAYGAQYTDKNAEYQNAYQAADVFTRNERNNYITLKSAADKKGYIICPKMRLADIVTPRNDPQYMSRFGKIKSKHLDFVIYDSDMRNIITVIELDDNSHNRPDRKERDEFVDYILQDCGIKIIHTRHISEDILDKL